MSPTDLESLCDLSSTHWAPPELFEQLRLMRQTVMPDWPRYVYPWRELDARLAAGESLPLAGYGSLMNRVSAARTFSARAVASSYPIVVFSARRTYDRVMGPQTIARFGLKVDDLDRGVLNAYPTHDVRDHFNAVRLDLDLADLESLREREFGYDLLPVPMVRWDQRTAAPEVAYILSCSIPSLGGRQLTATSLNPHPGYHDECVGGCREISQLFFEMFEQTTWVGPRTLAMRKI